MLIVLDICFSVLAALYDHIYKSKDQPGMVANPARGQLDREDRYFIRCRETGSVVPSRVSLLISILRLNLVLTSGISPDFR